MSPVGQGIKHVSPELVSAFPRDDSSLPGPEARWTPVSHILFGGGRLSPPDSLVQYKYVSSFFSGYRCLPLGVQIVIIVV